MKDVVIHCVFDGKKGMGEFTEIGYFCLKERIPCIIRPFSHTYEEDKDEILRLPAYHLYYQNKYELTFYPGDCPQASLGEVQEKSKGWRWPFRLTNKIHIE